MKNKYITLGTALAFTVNFLLFAVKLYIGLSVNSVSIYSDAVNNLFDSLSGLLSFVCLTLIIKGETLASKSIIKKSEDLLSFIVSTVVGIAGLAFAYSCAERLMYPTPVWYQKRYLYILMATAVVKIALYFAFNALYKKSDSPLLKVIATDSLLDFFITAVSVMSLLLSSSGTYSIDAFCGIGISVFLTISAIKLMVSCVKRLICFVPKDKREELETGLYEIYGEENVESIMFFGGEKLKAVAEILPCTAKSERLKKLENETGIAVHIIIKEGSAQDLLCEHEE